MLSVFRTELGITAKQRIVAGAFVTHLPIQLVDLSTLSCQSWLAELCVREVPEKLNEVVEARDLRAICSCVFRGGHQSVNDGIRFARYNMEEAPQREMEWNTCMQQGALRCMVILFA